MIETLREIIVKIVGFAKILVPVMAIFELIRWAFDRFVIQLIKGWLKDLIDGFAEKIQQQFQNLQIDLTPPEAFTSFVAKANVIIPLEEAWHYMLLYLAVASVVLGIKWMRNLIPGLA